jgi:hypothetical protein
MHASAVQLQERLPAASSAALDFCRRTVAPDGTANEIHNETDDIHNDLLFLKVLGLVIFQPYFRRYTVLLTRQERRNPTCPSSS